MADPIEIDRLTYRRVAPPARPRDATSAKAKQFWDIVEPDGGAVVAHAEVFEKPDQWGVRLFDRAPQLDEIELTRIVANLLVWHAGAQVETVELWLARNGARSVLVRVRGDYV
ncbi:MAG: hypothetical protein U0234_06665 [Sandaracinus sp.]